MATTTGSDKGLRLRFGGPMKVLLVAGPPALLRRMADIVRSIEGVELAAEFGTPGEAIDWVVWERQPWHLAYVDVTLPRAECEPLIQRLVDSPRGGTVVGITNHLWREVREHCAQLGVYDIVEKGDVVAFRSDLEARV